MEMEELKLYLGSFLSDGEMLLLYSRVSLI